ncbi:MAG TPA: homocysteine S-methyltransferase family protein [Bryobacteraceae bacterium]|nr:homocysteine S-methyltransferase family protein [Bryobacteraceae bacterium]
MTDGAWGTELQRRGLRAGECPDALNLTALGAVAEVARAYVDAGSQVILTNTFRANALSLAACGLAERVREINKAGALISREATDGRALVFGSIGPTGEVLALCEDLRDRLFDIFAEQATALAEGGVDAIVIETMSDVGEAKIALAAARSTGLPVVVSFAFDTGRNKDRTMTGVTPEQAAIALTEAGASAVGANCGAGIETAIGICRRLHAATDLPLWLKPNAGLPRVVGDRIKYDVGPEDFASQAPALVQAGAAFVGACCGSNPAFISACARVLRPACA